MEIVEHMWRVLIESLLKCGVLEKKEEVKKMKVLTFKEFNELIPIAENTPRLEWKKVATIPWDEKYFHFNCPKNKVNGWEYNNIPNEFKEETIKNLQQIKIGRRPAVSCKISYPEAMLIQVTGGSLIISLKKNGETKSCPPPANYKVDEFLLVVKPNYTLNS